MPSSPSVAIRALQTIFNAQIPPEGPKALNAVLNFTGGVSNASVDLTQQTLPPAQISLIQGVFIDNSLSAVALVMTVNGTGQKIVCPPNSQMYSPVFAPLPPIFTFNGFGNASPGVAVPVFFTNVPLPAMVWSSLGAGGSFSFSGSNLLVQDTAAEASLAALQALISAGGLNVNIIAGGGGGGGGGFDGPLTWNFAGINSGSGSANLYTPASGKKFYINNIVVTLQPGTFNAGGLAFYFLTDGGTSKIILNTSLPTSAPVVTGPGSSPIIFQADDMGWLSSAANNSFAIVESSGALSGGGYFVNFSTLIGDHA